MSRNTLRPAGHSVAGVDPQQQRFGDLQGPGTPLDRRIEERVVHERKRGVGERDKLAQSVDHPQVALRPIRLFDAMYIIHP